MVRNEMTCSMFELTLSPKIKTLIPIGCPFTFPIDVAVRNCYKYQANSSLSDPFLNSHDQSVYKVLMLQEEI